MGGSLSSINAQRAHLTPIDHATGVVNCVMVLRATSVNPKVLQWARVRAGLTVVDAAEAIGRSAEALEAWENGSETPTYRQLADLAQRVYRRPLAVFFFPSPPTEESIASEFRTLPDSERERLEPDTLFALRDARAWQLSAKDVFAGTDESFRGTVADLRAKHRETPTSLAHRVRSLLGISLAEQLQWRNADEALKAWRFAIERFAILVFKRPFDQESVSGFCLDDPQYPVVVINNATSHTRQIFTLLHELGHLAYGVSGVTTRDEDDLGSLSLSDRRIEIACNRFAAEALVPPGSIDLDEISGAQIGERISGAARALKVSREVVLRRLLDAGRVDSEAYTSLVEHWREDYLRQDERTGGGSYYANVGTYLSDTYARAVFFQYHSGRIGIGDAADHLRMKARNLDRFESFLLSRGRAE